MRRLVAGFLGFFVFCSCTPDQAIAPRVATPSVATDVATTMGGVDLVKKLRNSAKVYCLDDLACYAIAFQFTDYMDAPQPYTAFTVYTQNLQGTLPPDAPSGTLSIGEFDFQFFGPMGDWPVDYVDAGMFAAVSTVGNVRLGSYPTYLQNEGSIGPPSPEPNWDRFFYGLTNGEVGCDVWEDPDYPDYLQFISQTCPKRGLDGWVKHEFTLHHRGTKLVPVRFHDFTFSVLATWAPLSATGSTRWNWCSFGGGEPDACVEFP